MYTVCGVCVCVCVWEFVYNIHAMCIGTCIRIYTYNVHVHCTCGECLHYRVVVCTIAEERVVNTYRGTMYIVNISLYPTIHVHVHVHVYMDIHVHVSILRI